MSLFLRSAGFAIDLRDFQWIVFESWKCCMVWHKGAFIFRKELLWSFEQSRSDLDVARRKSFSWSDHMIVSWDRLIDWLTDQIWAVAFPLAVRAGAMVKVSPLAVLGSVVKRELRERLQIMLLRFSIYLQCPTEFSQMGRAVQPVCSLNRAVRE